MPTFVSAKTLCGSGSVGRALASQAEGRGFESRLSLILSAIFHDNRNRHCFAFGILRHCNGAYY